MQDILLISGRLYEILLNLYPKEFRAVYDRQMTLTFRDASRSAYHRNGAGGLITLWLPTLLDLFKSALESRARQGEITMSKAFLMKSAGPLTITIGLLWMLASVGEFVLLTGLGSSDSIWDFFWLLPLFLSLVPMLFAFIGIRMRFHQDVSSMGKFGLALSVAGCAGMIIFLMASFAISSMQPEVDQSSWTDYIMAACLLGITTGQLLFGFDALRYNVLPRWNLLPVLVGIIVILRFVPDLVGWQNYHPLQLTGYFLHLAITGACWFLFGIAMMEQRPQPQLTAAI